MNSRIENSSPSLDRMATPPPAPSLERRQLIVSTIAPIEQTFYLVTKETLDAYASAGFFANLFPMVFRACAGGFVSGWVGEATSAIANEVKMVVSTAKYGLFIFAIIFLGPRVVFVIRRRNLRSWIFKLSPPEISAKT